MINDINIRQNIFMNLTRTTFMAIATTIISSVGLPSLTLAQEVLTTLQQQMSYAEARQILIGSGWQAIEISPTQREHQSSTLAHLIDLGYTEVVDRSGTGMGFCRFEFAAADGRKLAVVTVNNQQDEDGSTLHRWWLEDN
jgi:hypothetical protein